MNPFPCVRFGVPGIKITETEKKNAGKRNKERRKK